MLISITPGYMYQFLQRPYIYALNVYVYISSYNTPDCTNKLNTVRFKAFVHFYDKYCWIHVEYFYVQSMEKRKLINLDICRQCKQQFVLIFSIPDLKIRNLNCVHQCEHQFSWIERKSQFSKSFLFVYTYVMHEL